MLGLDVTSSGRTWRFIPDGPAASGVSPEGRGARVMTERSPLRWAPVGGRGARLFPGRGTEGTATGLFSATRCGAGGTCSPRGTLRARLKVTAGPRGSGRPGPQAVDRAQARVKPLEKEASAGVPPARALSAWAGCCSHPKLEKPSSFENALDDAAAGSKPPSCLGFARGGFVRLGLPPGLPPPPRERHPSCPD